MTAPLPINPPLPFTISGNRATIPIHPDWNEADVMGWLAGLLRKPAVRYPEHDTPPFSLSASFWQLDTGNDWWGEWRTVPATPEGAPARTELVIVARYAHQPLLELAAWVAARLGPR